MPEIPHEEEPLPGEGISGSREITLLAHLYRAEVYRASIWRTRLDMSTNWAVLTTGVALSVSYASAQASPLPLILVGLLVTLFLFVEARRYRYFHVWRTRARLLEIGVMVPMLRGEGAHIPTNRGTVLSEDYRAPQFRITLVDTLGRRLRRNYLWIFLIQAAAYVGKLLIHPEPAETLGQFIERAAVGPLNGWTVLGLGVVFHGFWIGLAVWTGRRRIRNATKAEDLLNPDEAV